MFIQLGWSSRRRGTLEYAESVFCFAQSNTVEGICEHFFSASKLDFSYVCLFWIDSLRNCHNICRRSYERCNCADDLSNHKFQWTLFTLLSPRYEPMNLFGEHQVQYEDHDSCTIPAVVEPQFTNEPMHFRNAFYIKALCCAGLCRSKRSSSGASRRRGEVKKSDDSMVKLFFILCCSARWPAVNMNKYILVGYARVRGELNGSIRSVLLSN